MTGVRGRVASAGERRPPPAHRQLADVVTRALDEDLGGDPGRDVTTQATIGVDQEATGHVVARADGVVAGLAVWSVVLGQVADRFALPVPTVTERAADGQAVARGDVVAELTGSTQVLLVAACCPIAS